MDFFRFKIKFLKKGDKMAKIKNIKCKKNCDVGWRVAFIKYERTPNVWSFNCYKCGEGFKIKFRKEE
jgi:hypothetical protein